MSYHYCYFGVEQLAKSNAMVVFFEGSSCLDVVADLMDGHVFDCMAGGDLFSLEGFDYNQ